MNINPIDIATLGTILGMAIKYVIDERKKGKNEKSNNGDIKVIKKQMATKEQLDKANEKIENVDKTVSIINTNVENMQSNCKKTTERFELAINNNRKEILGMAKERK